MASEEFHQNGRFTINKSNRHSTHTIHQTYNELTHGHLQIYMYIDIYRNGIGWIVEYVIKYHKSEYSQPFYLYNTTVHTIYGTFTFLASQLLQLFNQLSCTLIFTLHKMPLTAEFHRTHIQYKYW